LFTPGEANVDDVNVLECQTSCKDPLAPGFCGIGLKASSSDPVPFVLVLLACTIQTRAEPDVVPFEVTTGAPDPNPKGEPELAVLPTSWK
jgi:hypothetical protein